MTDPSAANHLGAGQLRLGAGEPVTPQRAGWRYLSFAVHDLQAPMALGGDDVEAAVVVLGGGGCTVGDVVLPGREEVDVFPVQGRDEYPVEPGHHLMGHLVGLVL